MVSWQLQSAKARLSELVRAAQDAGPQQITLHGAAAVVVVSKQDYDRLAGRRPSFLELMQGSPLRGTQLPPPQRKTAPHVTRKRR